MKIQLEDMEAKYPDLHLVKERPIVVGKCFSLNKEGIEFFTQNNDFLSAVLIKHNIVGFNLISFLNDHEQEIVDLGFREFYDHFRKEQEVISLQDLGLIGIKEVSSRADLLDLFKDGF